MGAYQTEQREFDWARALCLPGDSSKSAEAELMDWADDVTYAVHDVDDFFRAHLIPLDRLATDPSERKRLLQGIVKRHPPDGSGVLSALGYRQDELYETLEAFAQLLPFDRAYRGTTEDRSALRSYTSGSIARYMQAIKLRIPSGLSERRVKIDQELHKEVTILKELTWHYVILDPALETIQHGQRHIVRSLFRIFNRAARKSDLGIFPYAYRDLLNDAGVDVKLRSRLVCDYISGMTERQATKTYLQLTGASRNLGTG